MKPSDSFHRWIEWSGEDGVYLGKCPDPITGIHGDDPVKLYAKLLKLVEEESASSEKQGTCRRL